MRKPAWLAAGLVFLCFVASTALAQPRIVRPAADEVVHSNSGIVTVEVTGVAAGSRLLPVLDGRAQGEPQDGPVAELKGVERGRHTVEVIVVGGPDDGARTPPVLFHVFHASRLLPQRRTP